MTSIRIDTKKLLDVFETYQHLIDGLPTKVEMNEIVSQTEKGYYEQLIYLFPPEYVGIVLKYFEKLEEYEICGSIKRRIEIHNRINGDNIKTNL